MSIFQFSDECLKTLEAFRDECVAKYKINDFKYNTLGLKLDEKSEELYADKEYLKQLIAKIPTDFNERLENTLKSFMKNEDKEWLDLFRFYAFVSFEEGDSIKILTDRYGEDSGLDIEFYNGVIKEPTNIKVYQDLFKILEFLNIDELHGLKNILENDYFNEDEILNEFFKCENFLYALLIWRDIISEEHFSIIYKKSYRNYPFDFQSSEEIFEELNEKLKKNGTEKHNCFFVEKGFYAKKNFYKGEVEELFEDADFSLLNDEKDMLKFLIKKIKSV